MQLTIEGTTYHLPTSLMQITLQERIEYDNIYGKALTERLGKIIDIKDDTLKEIEFTAYQMELACKTLSFFGKIPLDVAEKTDIRQVMTVYHNVMKGYSEDVDFSNKEEQLVNEFEWNGDTWTIAPPMLDNNSQMTFGEFVTAKQVIQDMVEVGKEKWAGLLGLACVYLRKKNEAFNEEMMDKEGERYELLKSLPLQYALHVGFFFLSSMNSWISTFLFSGKQEVEGRGYQSESI